MSNNGNQPAYPAKIERTTLGVEPEFEYYEGMTKREHFVLTIASGLASDVNMSQDDTVEVAFCIADKLLAELEKKPEVKNETDNLSF